MTGIYKHTHTHTHVCVCVCIFFHCFTAMHSTNICLLKEWIWKYPHRLWCWVSNLEPHTSRQALSGSCTPTSRRSFCCCFTVYQKIVSQHSVSSSSKFPYHFLYPQWFFILLLWQDAYFYFDCDYRHLSEEIQSRLKENRMVFWHLYWWWSGSIKPLTMLTVYKIQKPYFQRIWTCLKNQTEEWIDQKAGIYSCHSYNTSLKVNDFISKE